MFNLTSSKNYIERLILLPHLNILNKTCLSLVSLLFKYCIACDFSEYADYETNNTDKKYAEIKKPYDLICSLPYTDPNSVRWFYVSAIRIGTRFNFIFYSCQYRPSPLFTSDAMNTCKSYNKTSAYCFITYAITLVLK